MEIRTNQYSTYDIHIFSRNSFFKLVRYVLRKKISTTRPWVFHINKGVIEYVCPWFSTYFAKGANTTMYKRNTMQHIVSGIIKRLKTYTSVQNFDVNIKFSTWMRRGKGITWISNGKKERIRRMSIITCSIFISRWQRKDHGCKHLVGENESTDWEASVQQN